MRRRKLVDEITEADIKEITKILPKLNPEEERNGIARSGKSGKR